MFEGAKRTNEKENTLQEFTLMFWQNQVLVGDLKLPLGECSTAMLNLSDETIFEMNDSRNALINAMQNLFNQSIKKDLVAVTEIQNKLNKVLDLVIKLPPFQYLIAERIVFKSMAAFLHADFFRGLMNGHCPRKCHNCGKYFLLLSGHNTCYCTNIAPNQKKQGDTKTCRAIGAHIKEGNKKRTPAQQEYDTVYNRLKTRKNRGKISADEWNTKVSEAVLYMEQNQRGELPDFEYSGIMKKL